MVDYKYQTAVNEPLKYNRSLDSLRFICVLGVVLCHWGPFSFQNPIGNHILQLFRGGMTYVDIFFVLSGYLITFSLLIEKNKKGYSFGKAIRKFYIKRVFRIFPIYYLLLLILFVCNYHQIREYIFYFISFTTNLLVYRTQTWNSFSHTWSLCVEEQFYLLWPVLILLSPSRYLKTILIASILSSIMIYIYKSKFGVFNMFLLPSSLFALALGGLLSYFKYYEAEWLRSNLKFVTCLFIACIFYQLFHNLFVNSLFLLVDRYYRLVTALTGFCAIYILIENENRLSFKWLTYLGEVSYGIFLYHYVILDSIITFFYQSYWINYLFRFFILIGISILSYELFEKKLIRYSKNLSNA